MSEQSRIETYVRALSRALAQLSERDRDDIVNEIQSHLEHRASQDRLDEAIEALGPPATCARSFLDELKIQTAFVDGGPVRTFGALLALASRRSLAAVGLFVAGVFFLLAAGFAITAITEIVAPNAAGLYIDPQRDIFAMGVVVFDGQAPREVLGRWLFPIAAGLSVLSFVAGQWLGRVFIRLMMTRRRAF